MIVNRTHVILQWFNCCHGDTTSMNIADEINYLINCSLCYEFIIIHHKKKTNKQTNKKPTQLKTIHTTPKKHKNKKKQ